MVQYDDGYETKHQGGWLQHDLCRVQNNPK